MLINRKLDVKITCAKDIKCPCQGPDDNNRTLLLIYLQTCQLTETSRYRWVFQSGDGGKDKTLPPG